MKTKSKTKALAPLKAPLPGLKRRAKAKASPKAGGEELGAFLERRDAKPAKAAVAKELAKGATLKSLTPKLEARRRKAAKAEPVTPARGGPRAGNKREVCAELLQRESGATTADLLAATGWPAISVPAVAKASNLTLRKEKRDGRTVYYGSAA